jgi:hypothetical protein
MNCQGPKGYLDNRLQQDNDTVSSGMHGGRQHELPFVVSHQDPIGLELIDSLHRVFSTLGVLSQVDRLYLYSLVRVREYTIVSRRHRDSSICHFRGEFVLIARTVG